MQINDIEINEETTPVMAIAALSFLLVLAITFGYGIFSSIGVDTGVEEPGLLVFSQVQIWSISILAIALIMLIIIGVRLMWKRTEGRR